MTRATRVLALALSTLMLAPALGSAQQTVGPGVEFTAPDKIKWVKNAAGTQETAVLAGDPDKAGSAADAYTRLRTVTTAAGVITANLQLLGGLCPAIGQA